LADEGSAFFLLSPRQAHAQLARVTSPAYLNELVGTIGADPIHGQFP